MFTTAPFAAFSAGASAWEHRKTPSRLVDMTRRHMAKSQSSIGPKSATPALFTSASTRPSSATACSAILATSSGSETSQCSATTPSRLPASSAKISLSRSTMATRRPSARKRSVVASPIPRAAPVTMAVFWVMSSSCSGQDYGKFRGRQWPRNPHRTRRRYRVGIRSVLHRCPNRPRPTRDQPCRSTRSGARLPSRMRRPLGRSTTSSLWAI